MEKAGIPSARQSFAQPADCRTAEYEFVNPFIAFILSRNRVAKNGLFANLAFAADDVLVSG